jgi:hypothetical protein
MEKSNDSGRLRIDDKDIVYSIGQEERWRIPAIRICVMGEYTTAAGPYEDDFFLVFVIEGGKWYEASFYVKERDAFLSDLSKFFNESINPGLCHSTDWNSRVVWPKELEGTDLFALNSRGGLFNRVKKPSRDNLKLSPAVLKIAKQPSA